VGLRTTEEIFKVGDKEYSGEEVFQLRQEIETILQTRVQQKLPTSVDDLKSKSTLEQHQSSVGQNVTGLYTSVINKAKGMLRDEVFKVQLPGAVQVQTPALDNPHLKHLKVCNEDGKMEIGISIRVLRQILPPKVVKNLSYSKLKRLAEKGAFDGYLYRIPTQGLNFAAEFTIKVVLPASYGQAVVFPTGFTIKSGSDSDADSLYTLFKYYNWTEDNGLEEYKITDFEDLDNNSTEALSNYYVDLIIAN